MAGRMANTFYATKNWTHPNMVAVVIHDWKSYALMLNQPSKRRLMDYRNGNRNGFDFRFGIQVSYPWPLVRMEEYDRGGSDYVTFNANAKAKHCLTRCAAACFFVLLLVVMISLGKQTKTRINAAAIIAAAAVYRSRTTTTTTTMVNTKHGIVLMVGMFIYGCILVGWWCLRVVDRIISERKQVDYL